MTKYYGYRCYNSEGNPIGWFYTANAERDYNYTANPQFFHWCKRWKTERGARKNFLWYNHRWESRTQGGYLKIEVMPETPTDPYERQQKWQEKNLDAVKESKAKYDADNPVWSVRIKPEIRKWLDQERWEDDEGESETNTALVNRKLEKLMKLEQQGY